MFNDKITLTEVEVKSLSSITLAFVGDAVYSLYVRENLILNEDEKAGALNKKSASIVSAVAQSKLIERILPLLTSEEEGVFKRARNAKKGTRAKNASVAEYNKSTGFEALVGYLYLLNQTERLKFLLSQGENYEN